MNDILVRAKAAPLKKKKGSCRSLRGTRCETCKHAVTAGTFRSFSTQREYCIKPANLSCRSSNVEYISFHANHAQNNTQVVLEVSDIDLTITS